MPRYNPFRPGSVVTPGMFSGRADEILALERVLFQTKNGNPQHFLIHGERGIGKSSLLYFLQCVARGEVESIECGTFKFLTVSVELEPSNTYLDIIRKIVTEFQRVVASHQPVKEIGKAALDIVKHLEVMGVKYSESNKTQPTTELLDDLTSIVDRTLSKLGGEFNGILILIDEADKPPYSANLGEFAKIFTERLTKRGCNKVSLGLAGLPTVLQKLRKSHESSLRLFEIFTLEPLLSEERVAVVRKGLVEARNKNGFEVVIAPDAEEWISMFSEGYPHFIQQFAYSAFLQDTDNTIDVKDVVDGAFRENGAFQQLGLKYFHELYFDQIGSDEYREVLRAMSQHLDGWVSKGQIREAARIKESTLNNAIKALKDRSIIIPQEGKKGAYRLPNKSFAVWIRAYTQARVTAASLASQQRMEI